MAIFSERDKLEIQKRLSDMRAPVVLAFFTQKLGDCQYCDQTEMLLDELSELSEKLSLEKYNLAIDKEVAERYGVDKVPAIVVLGVSNGNAVDYGIKFFGIPAGYEFATLLEDILMVSQGDSGLSESTRQALASLQKPVEIKVFVTPSCPYCQVAVLTAHRMAFESDKVVANMIEASEFPRLSSEYGVQVVPKVVINDLVVFEGAVPEELFAAYVLKAAEGEVKAG